MNAPLSPEPSEACEGNLIDHALELETNFPVLAALPMNVFSCTGCSDWMVFIGKDISKRIDVPGATSLRDALLQALGFSRAVIIPRPDVTNVTQEGLDNTD